MSTAENVTFMVIRGVIALALRCAGHPPKPALVLVIVNPRNFNSQCYTPRLEQH